MIVLGFNINDSNAEFLQISFTYFLPYFKTFIQVLFLFHMMILV
jgi:hypothetical protein